MYHPLDCPTLYSANGVAEGDDIAKANVAWNEYYQLSGQSETGEGAGRSEATSLQRNS